MLRPEREDDRILGRRGLQLEIEAAAEALPQGEPPGPVDPAPERRVQHELHPACLVEEPLDHDRLLRRDHAEDLLRGSEILDHLARGGLREPRDLATHPRHGRLGIREPIGDVLAQPRHGLRQLRRARRRLADPERDGRRLPLRVHDPHLARLDLANEIGGVAELEDVARHALDREVLVERADERVGGLEHHPVVADVGDGPSRRYRRESGAATGPQPAVHPVIVNVGAAPAAPRGEALGEHLHDVVEVLAREVAVGIGAAHELVQRPFVPLFACHRRHELLSQDVERAPRDDQPVEPALARGADQRRALDQLVTRQRKDPPLGYRSEVMSRPAHPLQQRGDRARRADLADQVHRADVDPELERRRGDERLELSLLEPLLRLEALITRQAAVMRRDVLGADALGKVHRHALGEPAGVHEHECGAVFADELGQSVVQLLPHFRRHHRLERRRGDLDREVELPGVARVDNAGVGCRVSGARQESGDLLDRLLGRGQTDALERAARQMLQPLEREREVAAALVPRHGVDLVHDHRAHRAEHRTRVLGREDEIQRLGSRDEDVRRTLRHRLAVGLRRIARANERADLHVRQAQLLQRAADLGERLGEVLLNVVRERLEGRDVHHLGLVPQGAVQPLTKQGIDRGEERRERLPRARGGRDQRVPAGLNDRPGATLRLGRIAEPRLEPARDDGMEAGERHHTILWRKFAEDEGGIHAAKQATNSIKQYNS